jgi:hypothetical protein
MISPFEMYILLKLDSFQTLFGVVGLLLLIFGAVLWFIVNDDSTSDGQVFSDHQTKNKKIFKAWIVGLIFTAISMFMPSTEEFIAIKAFPAIATSERVDKVTDLLDTSLSAALNWAKGSKEDKK